MGKALQPILEKAIDAINKKLAQIDSILDFDFISEITKLRREAALFLSENKELEHPMPPFFMDKLREFSVREKGIYSLADKQNKAFLKTIRLKHKLLMERDELISELNRLQRINIK